MELVNEALNLINEYLREFPEHDPGDFRIWRASQLLQEYQIIQGEQR